jgi:polyisoprenoid-binding protein YceI
MSTATEAGLIAGTWTIDPAHSEVAFIVRHLAVSKVRGKFLTFEGSITVAEDPLGSSVSAKIDTTSVDTGEPNRDTHLKSPDFFDTESHSTITFESTSVAAHGSDYKVEGNLTVHGTTKPVTLNLEFNGVSPDPWGGTRAGFSATTEISRKDFGVDFNIPLDGGGVVVGDKIKIELEIEAIKA